VTLEEAWRAVEEALPVPESVLEGVDWEKGKEGPDLWHARVYRWDAGRPWHRTYAEGATPEAALRALAARLAEQESAG
jgi:hypothetical protein